MITKVIAYLPTITCMIINRELLYLCISLHYSIAIDGADGQLNVEINKETEILS